MTCYVVRVDLRDAVMSRSAPLDARDDVTPPRGELAVYMYSRSADQPCSWNCTLMSGLILISYFTLSLTQEITHGCDSRAPIAWPHYAQTLIPTSSEAGTLV